MSVLLPLFSSKRQNECTSLLPRAVKGSHPAPRCLQEEPHLPKEHNASGALPGGEQSDGAALEELPGKPEQGRNPAPAQNSLPVPRLLRNTGEIIKWQRIPHL